MENPKSEIKNLKSYGFTLIELLVVIAIISLLVSVLLPSLNRAKDLAKRVVCATQLKQIGVGLVLYAQDYGDWFPPNLYEAGGNPFGYHLWTGYLYPEYACDPNVFRCPTMACLWGLGPVPGTDGEHLTGYSYARDIAAEERDGLASDPSLWIVRDANAYGYVDHNGEGVNCLYIGGWVNWVPDGQPCDETEF